MDKAIILKEYVDLKGPLHLPDSHLINKKDGILCRIQAGAYGYLHLSGTELSLRYCAKLNFLAVISKINIYKSCPKTFKNRNSHLISQY